MDRPGRLNGFGWLAAALLVAIAMSALSSMPAWAKRAKLDKKTVELAEGLCKDREAAFAQETAMSTEDFQKAWTALADELDTKYAGKKVKLGKFGSHIRLRQQFTLLVYVGLRMQTKGVSLEPSVQAVVARHTFLQMLMTEGSCYTRSSRFPKKMSDFIAVYPQMALMIRQHIDTWEPIHKKAFERAFPVRAANVQD